MAHAQDAGGIGGSFNLADKWASQYENSGGTYNPAQNQAAVIAAISSGHTAQEVAAANPETNLPVTGQDEPTVPYTGSGSSGGGSSRRGYTAAVLPSATSQADYINAMYDANEKRKRAALEAEYDANVSALDRQAAGIPAQYQAAANQASSQAAINRAAFNEQAAAAGLNTGAAGQAALAQNNALLANISSIRQAQSEAMNDIESQRVALQTQYQKAIADAIANNEADRAAALYNEQIRVDESLVSTAINQATENYRAWQAKYG